MIRSEARRREKAERARRREICAGCPALGNGAIKTCTHCHCPIVFVTISGPCPLQKW